MANAHNLIGFAPPPGAAAKSPAAVEMPARASTVQEPLTQTQRKLVRPAMPEHLREITRAPRRLRGPRPLAAQEAPARSHMAESAAGTAEALFFDKQIMTETPLIFVMEDGEQIQGAVEWYDRESIKIRGATRTLLFKRAIKYLYKANESRAD